MIYHTYGSTDAKVSAIGFGGMRFENRHDIDSCASLVKAAFDAGINYFDTAPSYTCGKSEEIFGIAFAEMKKIKGQRPFYVSTKSMKTTPAEIRKDIETSLTRMALDYIDFYHLWSIQTFDEYLERKKVGVLSEFERLKEVGFIKHICISTHMTGPEIEQVLTDYPFEGVLLSYSAMNFAYRDTGLDAAARLNRGLVVMNPLGGGIIPKHAERFNFVRTNPAYSAVTAALQFLINDPRITISLVGFGNQKHLDEAITAIEMYKPISPATITKIRNGLCKAFNQLCTMCRYCDNCPQRIPIPKIMDVYNLYMLGAKQREMINQLIYRWGISLEDNNLDKCTECGQCEAICTQKLPIRQRLKFIQAEVQKFLESKTNSNLYKLRTLR
jgi:predicted aldo/keto reductase-like oxidoreductase